MPARPQGGPGGRGEHNSVSLRATAQVQLSRSGTACAWHKAAALQCSNNNGTCPRAAQSDECKGGQRIIGGPRACMSNRQIRSSWQSPKGKLPASLGGRLTDSRVIWGREAREAGWAEPRRRNVAALRKNARSSSESLLNKNTHI